MLTEETLDLMEGTMDSVEGTLDVVEKLVEEGGKRSSLPGYILVGAAAGIAGGVVAYFVTKRVVEARNEKILEQEIKNARQYYAKDWVDEEGEVEGDRVFRDTKPSNPAEVIEQSYAGRAYRDYRGEGVNEDDSPDENVVQAPEEVEEEVEEFQEEQAVNVFVESRADENFDIEAEMENRTPDKPYVISEEEFGLNEEGFSQVSITYYEGDGTLADERDQEIPFPDPIVGEDNLIRFGDGSGDPNVVYIRNERLSTDFEVLRSEGKYAHEVLGLQHSDGGSRARRLENAPRKVKGDRM